MPPPGVFFAFDVGTKHDVRKRSLKLLEEQVLNGRMEVSREVAKIQVEPDGFGLTDS